MKPSQTNQRLRKFLQETAPRRQRKSTETEVIGVRKRKHKESDSYHFILAPIVFIILLIFVLSPFFGSGGSSPNVYILFLSLRSLQTVNIGPELDNFAQNIR